MVILTVALGRVTAQEVEIKKSADVIVLQGKSFYLHTVLPGQTLFAICKAYEVNVEDIVSCVIIGIFFPITCFPFQRFLAKQPSFTVIDIVMAEAFLAV